MLMMFHPPLRTKATVGSRLSLDAHIAAQPVGRRDFGVALIQGETQLCITRRLSREQRFT